ncbi:MAG TPA: hypothetical protein VH593_10165 [Ktedonobacteraceae bacterium]
MTQLSDVTKNFTDGLSRITGFVPNVISNFQNADHRLNGQEDGLINGYDVPFAGMGAMAFTNATDNNIQLSGRVQQKLQEFVTASDNTNKQTGSINDYYEGQLNNKPLIAGIGEDPLAHYNYGWKQVTDLLRDGVLAYYIDIGGVFDFGLPFLIGNLQDMRDAVKNDIKFKAQQNKDGITQQYNQFVKQHADNFLAHDQYTQQIDQEEGKEGDAMAEVDQIYSNQDDAFSGWYSELDGLLSNYRQSLVWTTATGEVTIGDLLLDLKNAPAPITIYRTKDGNLVVLVNDMNNGKNAQQNAALVQQAIAQYDALNNISNPKVTILGYKGGSDIVQNLAHDSNNPFQIGNVILVGGKAILPPAANINYTLYAAPGDHEGGTDGSSTSASTKATLAVDAGEIALGAVTGGWGGAGIAFGEVVVGTEAPVWASGSSSKDVSRAENGGLYNQIPAGSQGDNNLRAVPIEPGMVSNGWGWTGNPFDYRIHHIDYLHSSFLDTESATDPKLNPGPGSGLTGVEPLSAPTYYAPEPQS